MTDMAVELLTRDNCPKCHALMLGLENKLSEDELAGITRINKEDDRERYDKLASQYKLKSLPAVVSNGRALVNPTVSLVRMLLRQGEH